MREHGAGLCELPCELDVGLEVRPIPQHPSHDRGKGDQAHRRRQHQRDGPQPPRARRQGQRRGARGNHASDWSGGRPDRHAQPGEHGQKQRQTIN